MEEPSIIYESKNFLAVNKPAGWLTHHVGQKKGTGAPALTNWLLKRYPEIKKIGDEPELRPGIVHRLDKDTSGIILVPRNQKYFLYLKSLFQSQQVKKTYLALVWGVPKKTGTIDAPIGIKSGTIRREVGSKKMSKEARTDYSVIRAYENGKGEPFALLEVYPQTGRTHQIRVHLKHIGHPIVGDPIYGRRREKLRRPSGIGAPTRNPDRSVGEASGDKVKGLMLHSGAVEFEEEPGKRIKIEAEPPEEFGKVLSDLAERI